MNLTGATRTGYMEYDRTWLELNERLRETEAAEGGLGAALAALEVHQRENGFIQDNLSDVERHLFPHPDDPTLSFRVQHNPKRALRFNGSGVGLHSIYRIRGPMGRVSNGCFFDSSTVRVIGSESHVALDLAFLKPQGKRRLNAAQCPLWVKSRHSAIPRRTSAIGGKADLQCLLF